MGRSCSICTHEKRGEIEAAVVAGSSYRVIAGQYGVGDASIQRHVASHIKAAIEQAKATNEEARGLDVAKQLANINKITAEILKRSNDEKKDGMSLLAIDRLTRQVELQAKLFGTGESNEEQLEEQWLNVREVIFEALRPYPEARRAVARALLALGRGDSDEHSGTQLG